MDAMIKSFRCSFCERGFSNAQALGGHMNIHRKDRAKLKEFSDENFLSLSVDFAGDEEVPKKAAAASDEKSRGLVFLRSKHESVRSLQLFGVRDDLEKEKMELIHIHGGVDLELRLGLHPHHEAKIKQY